MSPGWVGFFCGAFFWAPLGMLVMAVFIDGKARERAARERE